MKRTQVQLTKEQSAQLKKLAGQKGVSVAELVRESVDLYLRKFSPVSSQEQKERALAAAGRFHSGVSDLSQRHDDYLAEAFRE